MFIDERVLEELIAIKKILIMANSEVIDKVLSEVVNTSNRRKMWILIDGVKMAGNIADGVGVSAMAVSKFLRRVTEAGLVKYEQGKPPIKLIDYTPPAWLEESEEE